MAATGVLEASSATYDEGMNIRSATLADLETIVGFNARLASESEGIELDTERLRAGVKNLLQDENRGFYLLAESTDGILGQLGMTFEWSDWRNGVFWWLQSVYVRPESRRLGILSALYSHVQELASSQAVCGIRLYVEKNNISAKKAYQNLGIHPTVWEMYETDFVIKRHSR